MAWGHHGQVAAALGVAPGYLDNVLNGQRNITSRLVATIRKVYRRASPTY